MSKEVWKPVVGLEKYYEISSKGNLKSLDRSIEMIQYNKLTVKKFKGKYLIPFKQREGYLKAYLCGKSHFLHRIVAKSFLKNPDNKPCVNHINGIKHDNRVENLEWVTYSENAKHSFRIGKSKINEYQKSLIRSISTGNNFSGRLVLDLETGIFYESAKKAAESINIRPMTLVSRIIRNSNKYHRFIYL